MIKYININFKKHKIKLGIMKKDLYKYSNIKKIRSK
jgi:hypothetical protein